MTETLVLQMNFVTGSGGTFGINVSYPDEDVDDQTVKAAMDAVLANAVVFDKQPVAKKSAYLIRTTKTPFSIDD